MRMRMTRVSVMVGLAMLLAGVRPAVASDQVIFLVRHAEKAPAPAAGPAPKPAMMADDPPLSAAGQARAAKLAALLASANIKRIFTTELRRTRETAAPLATRLKLQPVMSASKDPAPLLEQVRSLKDNVLIVGHSNTVPELLKGLGIKDAITIPDPEYDNLFIVVRPVTGEATLIRLRY